MGEEETAAAAVHDEEFYTEFMNFAEERGSATDDGNDDPPMEMCDFCSAAPALVFCRADKARLCLPCDRHVHVANGVSSRHCRSPLCSACQASPATLRSCDKFLCTNCDFDRHSGRRVVADTLRDGRAVEGYTACPSASEIAVILGVGDFEKAAGLEDGNGIDAWWSGWEEPQVLTLEDLIIPTTSCHNFQPLMTPSSPKTNPNPESRKYKKEILRQLHELTKSEAIQDIPVEDVPPVAADQPHPWGPEYNLQGCNLSFQTNHDAPTIAVAASADDPWNSGAFISQPENYSGEVLYEQSMVSSTEASLCSFVEMADICPGGISNTGSSENNLANFAPGAPAPVITMRGGYEVSCAERDSIISRYKEKRKTRRYDKLVRYESRKARADGRTRIKGRFAKTN